MLRQLTQGPARPVQVSVSRYRADSITAALDHLGSPEAVLIFIDGAFASAALFAATHPSRTTALVGLEVYAIPEGGGLDPSKPRL